MLKKYGIYIANGVGVVYGVKSFFSKNIFPEEKSGFVDL